jgi:hypothetical protein
MSKKTTISKQSRPLPKQNQQIPNSMVRQAINYNSCLDLQHAREYPLYGCWIMADWQDAGISPVVVARLQEPGKALFGVYLVDLYCLGVKDSFIKTDYSLRRFERDLPKLCAGTVEKCSVELAHEVIYGALEYAEKLGFQPSSNFNVQKADMILDLPGVHPRQDHVSFGKDGKPFFVSGPNDDNQKIKSIINILTRTCGEENFHYLIRSGEQAD